jgi:uncharacterized protein YkwD
VTLPQRPTPPTAPTTQIPIRQQGPHIAQEVPPQPWLVIGGRTFGRPGPVALAAIVAGVLALFGVGAIVIPELTSSGTKTAGQSGTGPTGAAAPPIAAATSDPANPDVISDTPTPDTTATTARPGQSGVTGNPRFEDQVVSLVNDERRKAHCQPVRADGNLRTAARAHSADMAVNTFVDHTGSDGSSPQDRMRQAGYTQGLSENIDRGHNRPQDVMKAWMHNGDDRGNILNCAAKAIGVGIAYHGKTPYWTQNFGRA